MSRCLLHWCVCWVALVGFGAAPSVAGDAPRLRAATFRCDVTPPPGGHPLIWIDPVTSIEDPLWAKGVVLDDGVRRCVLCVLDWCGLCNSTHELFVSKVAASAGTDPSRVAVHCVHQHTAPYTDGGAQRLLDATENPPRYADHTFLGRVTDRLGAAVKEALGRLEPVDQVGVGEARVDRVAATRRVVGPEGKILVRYSACKNPELRAYPEGPIDPMLKTITLARGGKPLVRMHYYATHPQTFYGDGRASADFVGHARDQLERAENVFQIYFNGCGGDVTVGKYNEGTREAREELRKRLLAGMEAAVKATQLMPLAQIEWRSVPVVLPFRSDPVLNEADQRDKMADAKLPGARRAYAAVKVSSLQRADQPFIISALALGRARILHLPGECMVAFQKYAQSLLPDRFVAVAAYGDTGTGYICTEAAYEEGGYEPSASRLAPQAEGVLKKAIAEVLK